MRHEFAATEDAFANGLDTIEPEAGLDLARGWQEALADADFDGADQIKRQLDQLVTALESGEPGDLTAHLRELGEATRASAEYANSEDADKVRSLGEVICNAC